MLRNGVPRTLPGRQHFLLDPLSSPPGSEKTGQSQLSQSPSLCRRRHHRHPRQLQVCRRRQHPTQVHLNVHEIASKPADRIAYSGIYVGH